MVKLELKPGWMKKQFDRVSQIGGWSDEMKMLVPEWWSCCGIGYPYNTTQCIKCGKKTEKE